MYVNRGMIEARAAEGEMDVYGTRLIPNCLASRTARQASAEVGFRASRIGGQIRGGPAEPRPDRRAGSGATS